MVLRRQALRASCAPAALQDVAGADHLRSPHPDSFGVRGRATLLFAKFVPGLASLSSPVAGQNGMSFAEFLFFDFLGATIWVSTLLAGGRIFGDALKRDPNLLDWVGRFSGALLLLGILGFFAARVYRRRRVLRQLVSSRLEPDELKRQLDAGEPVYIVDLRHPLELLPDPFTLPGALHFSPEDLAGASMRFRATATSCSTAPVRTKPPRPKRP